MRARLVFLAFLGLGGWACGDSDDSNGDGPMCGEFEACGGKLEGSWTLEDACFVVLEQPKLGFCKEATAELQTRFAEGSVTFDDDLFTRSYALEADMLLKLPESCRGDAQCSDMSTELQTGTTLLCKNAEGDNNGCECTVTLISNLTQDGGFTIRGNRVQLGGEELGYCVKGDTLTLRPTSSINMSGINTTSILQTTFKRN